MSRFEAVLGFLERADGFGYHGMNVDEAETLCHSSLTAEKRKAR
jgi:hypothetical protein